MNNKDLLTAQKEMLKEHRKVLDVGHIPYSVTATSFTIDGNVLRLEKATCDHKKLIFSALHARYYQHYVMGSSYALSVSTLSIFLEFLDTFVMDISSKMTVLKDFEAYRVKKGKVKTQSTGLAEIKKYINQALSLYFFCKENINQQDYDYLYLIANTKVASDDPTEQLTLSNWFGKHSWLRRHDVGIGHELYKRASFPKSLMESLEITVVTSLLEINKAKHQLINLLKDNADIEVRTNIIRPKESDFDNGRKSEGFRKTEARYKNNEIKIKQDLFNLLGKKIKKQQDIKSFTLISEAMVYSQCTSDSWNSIVFRLLANLKIYTQQETERGRKSIFKQSTQNCLLFSPEFIRELVKYNRDETIVKPVPVSKGEELLFSIMLSIMTVPATDLLRLKLSNFKFIKRQNGVISQIQSEYFKTRSKKVHTLDTISLKTDFGRAFIAYLNDKTASLNLKNAVLIENNNFNGKTLPTSFLTIFYRFITESSLRQKINVKLAAKGSTQVFPAAINKIAIHGESKGYDKKNKEGFTCETRWFSASYIKNSSIHKNSDDFDPTSLINNRSHSNDTERLCYLTEENEVWQNNTGRITRTIMNDILINVLRPSLSEREKLKSEYLKATKFIYTKKQSLLSKLKIVASKNGEDIQVDDLGLVTSSKINSGDLSDTIYLLQSPETVLKLKHYIAEVDRTHIRLFENNPEFLFNTALPTVEWIHAILTNSNFKKKVLNEGESLYNRLKEHLPPLFNAHTGGV
jgi:hypothetical protein